MADEVPQQALPNGIPPPPFKLPVSRTAGRGVEMLMSSRVQYPESADVITANMLKLTDLTPDE